MENKTYEITEDSDRLEDVVVSIAETTIIPEQTVTNRSKYSIAELTQKKENIEKQIAVAQEELKKITVLITEITEQLPILKPEPAPGQILE